MLVFVLTALSLAPCSSVHFRMWLHVWSLILIKRIEDTKAPGQLRGDVMI